MAERSSWGFLPTRIKSAILPGSRLPSRSWIRKNLAVSSVARLHSTTASAVHNMCRQIGATLGIAVLGLIPGSTELGPGLQWAMAVIAAVLLAAAVAVRMFTRHPSRVAG